MIHEWKPAVAKPQQIDPGLLQKFAQINHQQPLNTAIDPADQEQARSWLKLSEQEWSAVLTQLEPHTLFPLAVFFTLAEQQLSGWQCGARNPAIWIFRWLRQHDQLPDKEQIRQLKKMTDNRFIPYGSVL